MNDVRNIAFLPAEYGTSVDPYIIGCHMKMVEFVRIDRYSENFNIESDINNFNHCHLITQLVFRVLNSWLYSYLLHLLSFSSMLFLYIVNIIENSSLDADTNMNELQRKTPFL